MPRKRLNFTICFLGARNQVNSFADKTQKPTTAEYLRAGLDEVLDRLNKNPNGLQSEANFISAVITIRNAKITEKLNRRLVCLTGVVAVATVLLVVVPFFAPSLEYERLESKIENAQTRYDNLQAENNSLKGEVQELRQSLSELNNQVENITLAAQKRSVP